MKQSSNIIVWLIAIFVFVTKLQATHMVGGEINYRCLGNDQYEIMVTVFRDCDTGVPWFDNPASIGVFDVNDSLIYDLRLTLRNNDTLDLNLTDPCLVAPPNVCIHTTTYLDTIALPFITGGYQVVYQRCCRNQDIVNIVSPTATGATYSSYISEQALLSCNSSAVFNEWPPVYICAGVPIVYDHSALDIDGDSIVYELCTPFTGASPSQSMPQPPNNPPYNTVTWQPPYSLNNMLGGPDSLVIDANTGLLTGTPDIIGVFVVGVCAKEYRNGVLISTTRRDFQYVVGQCGRISSSSFFAPEIQCDNSLIVNFQNNSATIGSGYIWSFGDSTNNTISNVSNPTYIYPDTGLYNVTLIVDPGTLCADTSTQQIYLQYESIQTNFDVTTANCTDSFYLDITDLSIDTISSIIQWNWDFGNGQTDTVPFPTTIYSSSGTYNIELNVLAANGCEATYTDTLTLDLPRIFSADTVAICPGDSAVVLNPGGNPNHIYQWAPAATLSNDTIASPLAFPNATTTYFVTVVVPNGVDTCLLERSITVIQSPPLQLSVSPDTITCLGSIVLYAQSNDGQIEWSTDIGFPPNPALGDSLPVPVFFDARYYVRVVNDYGCSLVDSVDVIKRTTPILVNWDYNIATCDSTFQVQFNELTADSSGGIPVAWEWQFGDGAISYQQNPLHQYAASGNYLVSLTVTTDQGCTGVYQVPVSILIPQLNSSDTVGVCPGFSAVQLNQGGNPALIYQWAPASGLSSTTAASPVASPATPTTYAVTITAVNGSDTCQLIRQVHVNFPPPFTVTVPNLTLYCGDSVQITASASVPNCTFEWSGDPSFNTIIGTGNPYTAVPFTFPFAAYYVRATDPYGCTATDLALVQQNPVTLNASFSYASLGCSDTIAIQFNDLTADTLSSPIVQWFWTTSDGQSSTLQHPIFVFTQSQPTDITLQVTNADGCSGQITQTLNLNIASLNTDTLLTLCGGDSVIQLNQGGNPALTYSWSNAASLSSSNVASPIASPPATPFVYTVTITGTSDVDTCFAIHDITVQTAPPLTIEVPKDTIVCSGLFNVQADIMNAQQIDWSFSPTFFPIAISNVTNFFLGLPPAPFDLQIFVRATDAFGCVEEDTVRILRRDVQLPVQFTTVPGTCNDTLDLTLLNTTVLPPGFSAANWTWTLNDGSTTNSFNASSQITSNDTNIIVLDVVASNGCSGTFSDTILYSIPVLNGADSIGFCGLDSVVLNPDGSNLLSYSWSPVTGLSDATLASPVAQPDSTTLYTVTVTAVNDTDTCSQVHQVLVSVDTFQFDVMPDTVVCVNQIGLFVDAPTAVDFDWAIDRDFNFIIGQSNPLQTSVNDSRWFYVRAASSFGCSALDSVYVQYRGNNIPVDFEMTTVACRDSVQIQFFETSGDTSIISWNWDFGNGQFAQVQHPISSFNTDSLYTVSLDIVVKGNCTGNIQKPLSIQIPSLSLALGDTTICRGDSLQLPVVADTSLYLSWSPSIGLNDSNSVSPLIFPDTNTTYVLSVYSINQLGAQADTCWIEDSLLVMVNDLPLINVLYDSLSCDTLIDVSIVSPTATLYNWSATSDFSSIVHNDSFWTVTQSNSPSSYYIRVFDSLGCYVQTSVDLISRQAAVVLPAISASCDSQQVYIQSNNLNASDSLQYQWLPLGVVLTGQNTDAVSIQPFNGIVQLNVVNQYGCTDTVQTEVVVAPPISLTLASDSLVCDSLAALWAYSSVGASSFNWSYTSDFSNSIGQQAQLSTVLSDTLTTFYVQVSDTFGCIAHDSVHLSYHPVRVLLDSNYIICIGDSLLLNATNLINTDSLFYQWSPNSSILAGQGSNQVLVIPSIDSNLYTLNVQNQFGCSQLLNTVIDVSDGPVNVSVSADKDSFEIGESVQLTASYQADYYYQWLFDSTLSNLTVYNPLATPSTATTYFVTVVDSNGCASVDSITLYPLLSICEEPNLFIANAFSPDGDGYNDEIFIQGAGITELYFVIYNRWGEQIFETKDIQQGWNGTYKGRPCSPDVYGYYIRCRCLDGNEFFKKGNITLLR